MTENRGGPVADRVLALVTPILTDLALELYDCEFGGGVLRITCDKPGGVDLDELALVTRTVSRELDHADVVPGRYTLEVSSPGLERPLRQPAHYRWAVDRDVVVRLREGAEIDRRLAGRVTAADDDGIVLALTEGPRSGESIRIAYTAIDRARSVFIWQPTPKPGGPKKKAAATAAAVATTGAAAEVLGGEADELDDFDEFDDDDLYDINDDPQEVAAP